MGGHLACLTYLFQTGTTTWLRWTCDSAAQSGSAECLQFAIVNGCPFDMQTAVIAAEYGNLACLRLLLVCGGFTDSRIATAAAHNGHVAILQYLRTTRVVFNERVELQARRLGV